MSQRLDTRDSGPRTLWRRFRYGGELRPLVCLAASAAVGLLFAGLAVATAWTYGMTRPNRTGSPVIGDVREGDVMLGLVIAGGLWLVALVWLWRPAVHLHRHSRGAAERERWTVPLLVSVALAAAVVVLSFLAHRQKWDDTHFVETGLWLLAAGLSLVFWLPAIFTLEKGRPIAGPDGRVNVHCADCGYAMEGLHTCVCPECGRKWTIDTLIAAQDYETLRRGADQGT